jgi:phosphoribosyl-dephospho-CoA transferase
MSAPQEPSGVPLHRHQLAWLSDEGWRRVLEQAWDEEARDCLAHWAAVRLPLVVTRQVGLLQDKQVALGLPAPGQWRRRRIALTVPRQDILSLGEFPLAHSVLNALTESVRPGWLRLCAELTKANIPAHVYGSHGWQLLSGLDHVRHQSDIDLWLSVSDAGQADRAAACLGAVPSELPRLDGELVLADGSAVAWREWLAWRDGRVKSLLVKRLQGCSLVHGQHWPEAASLAQAA